MKKYIVVLSIIVSGCSSNPNPTTPTSLPGTATGNNIPVDISSNPKWPVSIPGDGYGKEDPRYPPDSNQCPVNYSPVYNGHNFVCENGTDREMPK